MVSELAIAVIVYSVFVVLNSLNAILGNTVLTMFFAWAYPNLDAHLAGYYLALVIAVVSLGVAIQAMRVKRKETASFFSIEFKGVSFIFLNMLLGGGLILFAMALQGRAETAILGVPTLAATGVFASKFNAATSGMLGIVENKFLFTIYDVFKIFAAEILSIFTFIPVLDVIFGILSPLLIIFLPLAIAVYFFAALHITVYALAAGALFFAALMMFIWVIGFETVGSLMADTFHFWWNAIIKLGKSLQFVTGSASGLEVLGT